MLVGAHYIYIIFICIILATMIMKKDVIIPSVIGIISLGFFFTGSITMSVGAVFNAFIVSANELMPVIFIISCMMALSKALEENRATEVLIKPLTKIIKNKTTAFFVIGVSMFLLSCFFWPSPATAIIGVIFLPVAKKVGLSSMGVAIAINIFGHGIALSSDLIIQGAPSITAVSAGISVWDLINGGMILFITMAVVTITVAYYMLMGEIKRSTDLIIEEEKKFLEEKNQYTFRTKVSAILVAIFFVIDVSLMFIFDIKGSDATALIGGTSIILMIIISQINHGRNSFKKVAEWLKEGCTFSMSIFSVIIPIAAFFYMGNISTIVSLFGENAINNGSKGLLFDLGIFLSNNVPLNKFIASGIQGIIAAITGLDGSGFSGLTLVGSVARVLGSSIDGKVEVLAALGQIITIYIGGGVLIPWAVVPVAAICKVDPIELARKNLIPVVSGIIATTIVAIIIV